MITLDLLSFLRILYCNCLETCYQIFFLDYESHLELIRYHEISYLAYYIFVIAQLILSCIADKKPKTSFYDVSRSEKENPSLNAGVISVLFFIWIKKLIWKGYKKPLCAEDVFDLRPEHLSEVAYSKFENAQPKR